jgi:hypothetical protein
MRNLCLLLTAVLLCSLAVPAQTREQVWHSGNEFLSICGVDADKTIDEETPAEIHATRDCIPYHMCAAWTTASPCWTQIIVLLMD